MTDKQTDRDKLSGIFSRKVAINELKFEQLKTLMTFGGDNFLRNQARISFIKCLPSLYVKESAKCHPTASVKNLINWPLKSAKEDTTKC